MYIYTENENILSLNMFLEATETQSTFIYNEIYPKVVEVLSTTEGKRKFSRLVEIFVNRNQAKLTTTGPQYLIIFNMQDKKQFFDLFNITDKDISIIVKKMVEGINDKANWQLFKNNPIFVLFYCIIKYFTIQREPKLLNNALVITALAFYPSIFSKYFSYEPNPGIMQYTIDNLSNRFIIKKTNHIFGTLVYSIQNSWKFHEKDFYSNDDKECVRFIQRIRNDQNSLLKKIANNYQENYKKGLSVQTTVDSYEDSIVVDNENDSNKVEVMTSKIVLQMLVNGIDLKLCDFASNASSVSKIELRNYLTKIFVEKNTQQMQNFIESILFLFLYDEKHEYIEINSKQFIIFALSIFKKVNSKNSNIVNIKTLLNEWGEESGIYQKFTRLGTRIDYTKAIFLYFILSIQKYT